MLKHAQVRQKAGFGGAGGAVTPLPNFVDDEDSRREGCGQDEGKRGVKREVSQQVDDVSYRSASQAKRPSNAAAGAKERYGE